MQQTSPVMTTAGARHRAGLFFLVALFLPGAAAAADVIHKWVDAEGRVHFGDRPPVAVETEVQHLEEFTPIGTAGEAEQQEIQQVVDEMVGARREKERAREAERRRAAQERDEEQARQAEERALREEQEREARQEALREQTGTYGTGLPAPNDTSVNAEKNY